ncbi:MAG TPA: hypothetical protein VK459_05790, partial [Polyangiaceae bacterium]|nr:hypothetical protein [Polyangiaceae bacterium]
MSTSSSQTSAASTEHPPAGRLAILTALVMGANAVPLPLLPDFMIARVRGAIAHDTATRHGLSLTKDARTILASADPESRALARRTGEAVLRQLARRVGPLAVLATLSRGLEAYALGLLFDRYIQRFRASGSVRIDVDEARRVRDAIDRSVLRVLSPALKPSLTTVRPGAEDLRPEATRLLDSILLTGASLPSYLERRLEAAFDEIARDT